MFGKYTVSLGRVHDRIVVKEQNESLSLRVDADAQDLVDVMRKTEPELNGLRTSKKPMDDAGDIARRFCVAIFGEEQTGKLYEFYNGDGVCVLNVCSRYFADRLGRLITKAQRKARL